MDEILKECQSIIDEICEKYNYDTENRDGNYSLKTVLLKVIPCMLQGTKPEDRQLFYQMLSHTPIVVVENLTPESYQKLEEQYLGNVNPHIIDSESSSNLGEYGKKIGVGAYVSEPILDENLQLQGKKSFLYIQKVSKEVKEFLGTDINVPHLIHELGHAWHAEKNQFTMQDDGTLKERIGTAEFIYSFSKGADGKFVKKQDSVTGLMIEEAMNTVAEENAMASYTGLSLEEMREKYSQILIPSSYQGYISNTVEYMMKNLHKENFENWRLYGDLESKSKIESLMLQTKYWQNREIDILPGSDSPRNYNIKRELISKIKSSTVQDFFKQYETTYFPDISRMTPLEKIDNVLFQSYNMELAKYNMGIDIYRDFINRLGYEGYSLINQSADLLKEQELITTVNDARMSDVNQITTETKSLAKSNENNIESQLEEKGENR